MREIILRPRTAWKKFAQTQRSLYQTTNQIEEECLTESCVRLKFCDFCDL